MRTQRRIIILLLALMLANSAAFSQGFKPPPWIPDPFYLIDPAAATVDINESVDLELLGTFPKGATFDWQVCDEAHPWDNIPNATNKTFNTGTLSAAGVYKYRVWIQVDWLFVLSEEAVITVIDPQEPTVPTIEYAYDASGNRTSRVIVMPSRGGSPSMRKFSTVETGEMGEMFAAEFPKFEDALSDAKITIYPNPTQGLLRVDIMGGEIPKDARIYLYNMQGAMIRQLANVSTTNELNISELSAGMYTMRIMLDKNNISTWKIIKE